MITMATKQPTLYHEVADDSVERSASVAVAFLQTERQATSMRTREDAGWEGRA